MSSVRQSEETIFRTRCIKRNFANWQPQRPATSNHSRIYISEGYRSRSTIKTNRHNLTTLQLKQEVYERKPTNKKLKNVGKFLSFCREEIQKQQMIKAVENGKDIPLNDEKRREGFVTALMESNDLFRALQKTIVESIAILGVRRDYEIEEKLKLPASKIGFILYGRVKLFNKDYKNILSRGDTIGEHALLGLNHQFKIRFIEPSSVLWLSLRGYDILREQSSTQGFRKDFNKFDTMIRMSCNKKKILQM